MKEYVEQQVKNKVERFVYKAFKILFMIIAAIAFILLFGYGFMLLWNWLMPEVFGLTCLNYWQAVGILVMAKLLFGSFDGHNSKKDSKNRGKHFKNRMRDTCKKDFSKWELYDEFWKEEGANAFEAYVNKNQEDKQ